MRFNPRPRVASDDGERYRHAGMEVSIHARVWRATTSASAFILIPSKFQSTPACGERLPEHQVHTSTLVVSIHARVWRATTQLLEQPRMMG